jgi:putative transposase
MKTLSKSISCKLCGSDDIVKFGHYRGIQRWWCKECHHKFADNDAIPQMKTPARVVSTALNLYFEGLHPNEIPKILFRQYGIFVTNTSVYNWVFHFSKSVIGAGARNRTNAGEVWMVTETVVRNDIKDVRLSIVDILDMGSRFLLASRLSDYRNKYDIKLLVEMAREQTGKIPLEIISDGWKGFEHGIELAAVPLNRHITVSNYDESRCGEMMKCWSSARLDRNKILRGLKKKDTIQLVLEGWLWHYNFFKPHRALNNQTLGEVNKSAFQFHNWWEVVNSANQKSCES